MAVIQKRESALEIIIVGDGDSRIGGRMDRRAHGIGHVDTEMRRHRFAIVDALAAEDAAQDSRRRPIERFREPNGVAVLLAG